MAEVVTFGETMILMNPRDLGPLKHATEFRKQLGGAESNVAVGLARLDRDVAWFSRLGMDPHGRYIESFVRGEGVETDAVVRDEEAPTGLMFKERRSPEQNRVFYYRDGSAASRLSTADLPRDLIESADYLHVTGITPALSDTCRETVFEAVNIANGAGVRVSVDPNLRLKLWGDEETMIGTMRDLFGRADVVSTGLNEADKLVNGAGPEALADSIRRLGPEIAIVKQGEDGAFVAGPGVAEYVPPYDVEPVDEIGAGDGFLAGFLAARLNGADLVEATRQGNAVGALATTVPGDVEGLPTTEELNVFEGTRKAVKR